MSEDKKPKLTPIFENLEMAIKVWWKNLKKFVFVYLWGLLFALIALVVGAIFLGLSYWQMNNSILAGLSLVIAILSFLVAFYFSVCAYLGAFLLVKKNYVGKELDIFKETPKYFWPYLGLTILTMIFVLLWTCLLIIPGIIYSVFYSLACFAFFFEDKRGLAAIRRSTDLITGYWWPVFGRFIVIGLIGWVVMGVVSAPLSGTNANSAFFHIWNLVIQVVSFLIGPIFLLYIYSIYQDLVKIKK